MCLCGPKRFLRALVRINACVNTCDIHSLGAYKTRIVRCVIYIYMVDTFISNVTMTRHPLPGPNITSTENQQQKNTESTYGERRTWIGLAQSTCAKHDTRHIKAECNYFKYVIGESVCTYLCACVCVFVWVVEGRAQAQAFELNMHACIRFAAAQMCEAHDVSRCAELG